MLKLALKFLACFMRTPVQGIRFKSKLAHFVKENEIWVDINFPCHNVTPHMKAMLAAIPTRLRVGLFLLNVHPLEDSAIVRIISVLPLG